MSLESLTDLEKILSLTETRLNFQQMNKVIIIFHITSLLKYSVHTRHKNTKRMILSNLGKNFVK